MNHKPGKREGCHLKGAVARMDFFRQEISKIMPGYKWTVHKPLFEGDSVLVATGIQVSGLNRLSTLRVTKREEDGAALYEVKSSGNGARAPWLYTTKGATLAQALRHLQDHYESMAQRFQSHAEYLQKGRQAHS